MRALALAMVMVMSLMLNAQPSELSDKTISTSINTGVVIVEFGADFVEPFSGWDEVTDCIYYRVDIAKYPNIKDKYRIRSIPTIILFNNGTKVDMWKANIMLELDVTSKDIQISVDDILSQKF
tara:strand:+ start:605 stop:973 length:369 start_codon:yes stop_codon:yes gene_type:complete